ncbi:hypothetical protein TNCV_5018771 [Trichonephila clavipes]|nr:hypothetical protein TNCV_5018771 [Trichonephila clavipes]
MIGKSADLLDFCEGQIAMVRRQGTSISEMACFVDYSCVYRPLRIHSREEQVLLYIVRNDRRLKFTASASMVSQAMYLNPQCSVHYCV